jgi:drug/metabolite transporter (DMT)-like permease
MHYIYFVITSLLWGGGFFLMKKAGFAFGPLSVGASSTFGGSLVLWGFWAIKRSKWQIHRRQVFPLAVVAISGYIFPYVAQPFLVNLIGHGFVGMVISLVPVLTIVVSIPILQVFPSRIQLLGVLVGMICLGLMVADGLDRQATPFFLLMAMAVPLCYAISNTLVQKYFQAIPAIVLAAIFMTSATVLLTPLSLVFEKVTINEEFLTAVGAIILLSVFARGVGMVLFYKMIQDKGPLFAGMVTYVIPVEALMWSWFDNERVTLTQILAIGIVLLVVGTVQRDIVRRGYK